MLYPVECRDHVGAVRKGQGGVWRPGDDVAAHTGSQVDHDVCVAIANTLNHFTVKLWIAGRGAGFRVADMAMRDGGACFCGLNRGGCNLLW